MKRILTLALISILSTACFAQQHPGAEEFAARAAEEYGLDPEQVRALLENARYKQSIVDAMTRPAESRPWFKYRPIFMTEKRIRGGVAFWREHEALIDQASELYSVDPHVIVAIIGVETSYGGNTGSFRVLDALTTLSFYYPTSIRDRSDFFSKELMNFIVLGDEEGLPIEEVTGSYAGAMGLGQFIPSSYREYAVDMDQDGRRDLWSSMPDVIGSVANYLHRHGWEPGQPVTYPAVLSDDADKSVFEKRDLRVKVPLSEWADKGITSAQPVSPDTLAAMLSLEEEDGDAYFVTFRNFYVITRYNRSPLYAMAVHELSEAIRDGFAQ